MENEAMIVRFCPTEKRLIIKYQSEVPKEQWPLQLQYPRGFPVGDRFYMQQNAKRRTTAKTKTETETKRTKAAVVADLSKHLSVDLKALTQADLEVLLEYFVAGGRQLVSHPEPSGRLKAPWVSTLNLLVSDKVDWSRCTVATMQAVYKEIVNVD